MARLRGGRRMTVWDIAFLTVAILEVVFVGIMGYVAAKMLETAKRGRQKVQPALREAKALADTGMAIAAHAREDGQFAVNRVKGVSDKIRQRVHATRHI